VIFALLVECERLVFGEGLIEWLTDERMVGARVKQSEITSETSFDDLSRPVDVDAVHHRVFLGTEVDLRGEVIDDVYAIDSASDVACMENRAGQEVDVEAGQGLGQASRLQNPHFLASLEESSNQNVAETAAATSYER
jgi:hypothetical protein